LTDNKYLALANIRLKMTKKINKKNGKLKLFYVVATLSETAFFTLLARKLFVKAKSKFGVSKNQNPGA
jgi:hypothetical protein